MRQGAEVLVQRAHVGLLAAIDAYAPTHLVISPGPKRPGDHPAIAQVLQSWIGRVPVLGVCLGMQALNEYFGGTLRRDHPPMHGKTSQLRHDGQGVFAGVPVTTTVARYHSLLIDHLGDNLYVHAWTDGERPMAIAHRTLPIYGMQFHPESFLSTDGDRMIANFLRGSV